MALIHEFSLGEEIVFDLREIAPEAKEISIVLTHISITGRRLEFKLSAHPSIKYKFFKQTTVPNQNFQKIGQ
jgi:hypothetical protein